MSGDWHGFLRLVLIVAVTVFAITLTANLLDKQPTFAEQANEACYPNPPAIVNAEAQTFECVAVGR